ncbi:unnamed protein product [Urochloa decumbens]|uniref:DUF295 domain-containing protein n=1 Tax=Urochloa decumbens TaxID=240449 RepID=A0ABC9AQ69_9POAL
MPPPLPPWSDLPLELVGLVLGSLPVHADRVRSAAVCCQWRAAVREVPLPSAMPLLAIPFAGYAAAAASGNWLLFLSPDDNDSNGSCFLRDPFSGATVPLPAQSRVWLRYKNSDGSPVYGPAAAGASIAVRRLLLCSPNLVAAQVRLGLRPRIAVCKPGAASAWWSVSMEDGGMVPLLGAMAFHQGKLFAVEKLYAIDVGVDQSTGGPRVSRVRLVISTILCCPSTVMVIPRGSGVFMEMLLYVVESRGVLLVVRRGMQRQWTRQEGRSTPTGWNEIDVFEADLQGCRWTQVDTIGDDQVLFLSGHHSRSLCVSQLGMPGDRIVFFENDDEDGGRWSRGESTSNSCIVYDMKGRKLDNTLVPKGFRWKCGTVRAAWLFPEDGSSKVC